VRPADSVSFRVGHTQPAVEFVEQRVTGFVIGVVVILGIET
jgi:hypothetical protein